MNMTRWVQHVSGQGAKWEVVETKGETHTWMIKNVHGDEDYLLLYLPKSEYQLCAPPEVWRDVTEECELFHDTNFEGITHGRVSRFQSTQWGEGYRLRKVQAKDLYPNDWAFIVEQTD